MFDTHRDKWNQVESNDFDVASTDVESVKPTLNGVSLRDGWSFNSSCTHHSLKIVGVFVFVGW